jgi:hypothetical protein
MRIIRSTSSAMKNGNEPGMFKVLRAFAAILLMICARICSREDAPVAGRNAAGRQIDPTPILLRGASFYSDPIFSPEFPFPGLPLSSLRSPNVKCQQHDIQSYDGHSSDRLDFKCAMRPKNNRANERQGECHPQSSSKMATIIRIKIVAVLGRRFELSQSKQP